MNFNLFNEITNDIRNGLNMPARRLPGIINNDTGADSVAGTANAASPAIDGLTSGFTFAQILQNFTNNPPTELNPEIAAAIASASAQYAIDPNLIRAVIMTESSYNPNAVSHAGAMGLMQLMPGTAASLGVTDPFDIWQNVHGGTRYLRRMLDRFDNNLELALAAYNAGAGSVNRFGGVPPFRETQNYIPRVQRHKQNYLLEQYQRNRTESVNL